MLKDKFLHKFKELEEEYQKIPISDGSYGRHVPDGILRGWATSVEYLLQNVFGENNPYTNNFKDSLNKSADYESDAKQLYSIFKNAKNDFEKGNVFDVDLRVSGEVFGDFVTLARTSLSEGYKDVASVLACAALEDALKRYARVNGLNVDNKTMSDVISALKSSGLVSGAQKTLLDAMPRIRNMALHADWGKISEPDISSVIGFVEQFLLTKFSPE